MKDELLRLAAICEKADGPDRELDVAIARVMRTTVWLRNDEDTANYETTHWRYTASIDAALSLVPEGLVWSVDGPDSSKARVTKLLDGHTFTVLAATPALALCAASLRTRASLI